VLSKDEVDAFEDHDGREKWQPEDPKLVRRVPTGPGATWEVAAIL
jgi:hypothetical protein